MGLHQEVEKGNGETRILEEEEKEEEPGGQSHGIMLEVFAFFFRFLP